MTSTLTLAQREQQLNEDRKVTRELIHEAKETALEGARVAERLRVATNQYRERLGLPPEESRR